MKYHLVRVYRNGDAKETWRDEAGKDSWLAYNRQARGGNTLFVNGVCDLEQDTGNLNKEMIQKISEILIPEYALRFPHENIDTIGPQRDSFGLSGSYTYHGYRPEPDRAGFSKITRG